MRLGPLLAAGIITAALITSCDNAGHHDCEGAQILPSPVAQTAPLAPDRPHPPRPRVRTTSPRKTPKLTKSTPRSTSTKRRTRHHHDEHDCDD
ncbi:hypothetical protein [Streptomyces sp. NPDC056785]|uniref:hypothetical protein n=1 Tax=Streptomyces sp. NPDC056785 TaxID=3345944 RepID=UPI0036AF6BB4